MKKLIARVALLLLVPMLASAQDADHQYHGQGYGFFGLGTSWGNPCIVPAIPIIPPLSRWASAEKGFCTRDLAWAPSSDGRIGGRLRTRRGCLQGICLITFEVTGRVRGSIHLCSVAPRCTPQVMVVVARPRATSEAASTCGSRSMPRSAWRFETTSGPMVLLAPGITTSHFASASRSGRTRGWRKQKLSAGGAV